MPDYFYYKRAAKGGFSPRISYNSPPPAKRAEGEVNHVFGLVLIPEDITTRELDKLAKTFPPGDWE